MTTDNLTTARPTSSTDWAEAVHNFERGEAAYDRSAAEYEAACAEYERRFPDEKEAQFEPYGLKWNAGQDRERLIADAELRIIFRNHKDRERLAPEELGAVREEAARAVAEFLAWSSERRAAYEQIVGDAERKHDAAVDKRHGTREALLACPAPDAEAILFKLELLAADMAEADTDDAERVAAIRDDAKRLFGRA
ncbi:MAG: hypothetical protein ACLGHC_01820 [Alphaproteobacteria bacterium]